MTETHLSRLIAHCGTLMSVKVDFSTMRPLEIIFISSMGVGGMILSSSSKTGQTEAEK